MATEANDMVIVTNANAVSLKKGTGEKTLFKLSNTVTSLGQGSFSTGLNAISIGSNGEGSGIIPFEEATEEVQGKLVINSIRRSGTGGSAPASNYVMMYNPDTVPNEATYSSDIPQQINDLESNLNGSTFMIGAGSSATGTNSMALGNNASTNTYNNAVAIGNGSTAEADNSIILGNGTQNVGIGTTSPDVPFEVVGNTDITNPNVANLTNAIAKFTANDVAGIVLGSTSGNTPYIADCNGTNINSTGLRFLTNSEQRMCILSNGNVGIGTMSPDNLLTIAGGGLQLSPYTAGTTKFLLYSENNVLQMNPRTSTGGYNNIIGLNMNSSGNVGIGTTSPSVPLHVSRATTITLSGASSYFEVHNGFKTNGNNLSKAISIKATDGIVGSSVFANSDLRIKENINDILDDSALQKLRQLNPKMYQYKDKLSRGDKTVYGFIAQEVGDILPLAVQTQEDSIPNIIQLVSIDVDHKTLHFYQGFNTQNLDASFNTLRIIDKENKEHFVDIEEIIDASHIRVDTDLSEIMGDVDESGNIIEGNKVFVYGQQVDDFHILDKNAIFTIATAALQEVDRQLQAEKAKVADLEAKNATLETQMADVLARLSALENP